MGNKNEYYEYLQTRSKLSKVYRKYFLYRKIKNCLNGLVLDVGCGIGDFLLSRPDTIGIDINEKTIEYCKSLGLNATYINSEKYPFNDSYFDGVVLDNVIEHLNDPTSVLAEIKRVLKPSGNLIIGIPGIKGYKSDPDHKIFYNENLLETLLMNDYKLIKVIHMPLIKSEWLSNKLSQYAIYAIFTKK
jgi:SAM-dependent methyltransferase